MLEIRASLDYMGKSMKPRVTIVGDLEQRVLGDLSSLKIGRKTLMGDLRQTRT